MQVAILAGGKGTRLGDMGKDVPKGLIEIEGKPFLGYQLEMLKRQGISDVVLCLGHLGEQVERHFGDGRRFGVNLTYSYEVKPLGTAGALQNASRFLEDIFFSLYGDSYVSVDFWEVFWTLLRTDKMAMMAVYKNENQIEPSNVVVSSDLVSSYNKRSPRKDASYIEYGCNLLWKDALGLIPEDRPFGLEDLFPLLIEKRELLAYEVKDRFYQIGSPEGLSEFKDYVRSKDDTVVRSD